MGLVIDTAAQPIGRRVCGEGTGAQVILNLSLYLKVNSMAVKVLINRLIIEDGIEDALPLLKELRIKAMDNPGYISGESLVNHYNPRNIMIIATWQTFDDWINWQESDERDAAEAKLERFLQEPAKYEVYDLGVLSKKKNFLI